MYVKCMPINMETNICTGCCHIIIVCRGRVFCSARRVFTGHFTIYIPVIFRGIFECRWTRSKCYKSLLMIYSCGLAGFTLKRMHMCDVWLNFVSRTFPMILRHVEWRNVPEFYWENYIFFFFFFYTVNRFVIKCTQLPTLSDSGKTEVKSKVWLELRSFSASILFFFPP